MQMVMDMWRVDPKLCGVSELPVEPTSGLVGYLVAAPADEKPFFEKGQFDIDAFDDASEGVFFCLTRDGFRAAHVALRRRCQEQGHTLLVVTQ